MAAWTLGFQRLAPRAVAIISSRLPRAGRPISKEQWGLAGRKMMIAYQAALAIGITGGDYFLQSRLNVSLPGVEDEVAQALVDAAHQTCPYSKTKPGNANVVIKMV
jgi:hypothetical protein